MWRREVGGQRIKDLGDDGTKSGHVGEAEEGLIVVRQRQTERESASTEEEKEDQRSAGNEVDEGDAEDE